MRSHPSDNQQGPHTSPRRNFLVFFKSVVEFFTGVIGMATAALGILGTVAAFALAGSASPGIPPVSDDRTVTPTATPTPSGEVDADEWAQAVNEECLAVAADIGDLSTFSAAVGALAEDLRGGPTPSGFEDEVASAADDFDQSADAAAADDADAAKLHADNASTTLSAVGVNGC